MVVFGSCFDFYVKYCNERFTLVYSILSLGSLVLEQVRYVQRYS